MTKKVSGDFFNGVNASRFDFSAHACMHAAHKAYVSVAFTSTSDNIYLQICPLPIHTAKLVANAGENRTVYLGEEATFDASGSRGDGAEIVGYKWDFGDGTNGTGMTASHVYTRAGTYYVKLTIYDIAGNSSSTVVMVNVEETLWRVLEVALIVGAPALATFTISKKMKKTWLFRKPATPNRQADAR